MIDLDKDQVLVLLGLTTEAMKTEEDPAKKTLLLQIQDDLQIEVEDIDQREAELDWVDEGEDFEYHQCDQCGMETPGCGCPQFADPTGHSALRMATKTNPRNRPCPTCRGKNRLTPEDVSLGYQCDECADRQERGGY